MTRILVIADTHARTPERLLPGMLEMVAEADVVVHCGDYIGAAVLAELRRLAKNFIGVFGNTDSREVRDLLPAETTFEVEGRKVAVTHPHWAGEPFGLEEEVAARFGDADVVLFGHTHEPYKGISGSVFVLNPGQGYSSFMVSATVAVLTVDGRGVAGEIITLQ